MLAKKKQIHQQCLFEIQKKIERIQQAMEDIQAAANEETKSSAGDKYETGRAMMQQEKDKLASQLAANLASKNQLERLNLDELNNFVQQGSLVSTNEGYYYISVPLGKIKWEEETYYAISTISPIGGALLGKKAGDILNFQHRSIVIREVS
ncbi:MAG: hypothetical protein R2828_16110 [Saprospiraceae bacterium]